MPQIRFDLASGELDAPVKNADGSVTFTTRAASTGPLVYRNPDGPYTRNGPQGTVVERRNLDELESIAKQLDTGKIPVCLQHPSDGMYSAGSKHPKAGVVESAKVVRGDSELSHHVVAKLRVSDPATIKAITDGDARGVSLGYTCDVEPDPKMADKDVPGVAMSGLQRNVKVDHAACVQVPRCQTCYTRGDACDLHRDEHGYGLDPDDDDPDEEDELDGWGDALLARAAKSNPYSAPDPNTPPATGFTASTGDTMSDDKKDCGCHGKTDGLHCDDSDYDPVTGNLTPEARRRRDRALLEQPSELRVKRDGAR